MYNGAFSCKNLRSDVKDGAPAVNSNEYLSVCTHCLVYFDQESEIYFDSFGVEHLPKKIEFIDDSSGSKVVANIF